MVVFKALALAALILVPGWLAASLLPEKALGSRERIYLAAFLGTGVVAASALALSLASAYSLTAMLVAVGLLSALLALAARSRATWPLRVGWGNVLLTLAVIAASLVLSVPPGRTAFGWSDVGMYADIAANIERTGAVTMESSTVREVAPERRDLVYQPQDDPAQRFLAYENKTLLITDFEKGEVVPTLYWLWPSFMAVFASLLGPDAMFWAVTAAGVLALWGLWLLSERLLGWRWGLAATVLAAVSPLFVYFSRYTTSEMMNMAIFMAGSLCLTAYLHADTSGGKESGRLAIAAAFIFTLGFLCRIDFLLVLVPLILFYFGKRAIVGMSFADWLFISAALAGAALATAVGLRFTAPYFHSVFGYLAEDSGLKAPLVGAGAALMALAFLLAPRLKGLMGRAGRARKVWIALLWSCMAGIFVYLYFIRPDMGDSTAVYGVINSTRGPSYISQTTVRWAWYFSFPGLVAIFSGYALWFSRRRDAAGIAIAMMGLALTLGYSINMRCTPLHILTMRRLVPVIFPVAVLMAAYCLQSLVDAGAWVAKGIKWGRIGGRLAAGALLLYLVLFAASASIPIFGLEEGGNQLKLIGDIAEKVEEGGVVLLDYHLGDLFGPPLRCFSGVENAWLMDNASLAEGEFSQLLSDLGFPGRAVYLLWRPGMSGHHVPMAEGLGLEEVGSFTSWEETLEKSFERRPESRRYDSEKILLYRIVGVGL